MKCYVCGDEAIQRSGKSNLCQQHARFMQMRSTAKNDSKYVPSLFELEKLVPKTMTCQDCGDKIHWVDDENRAKGAVLQHYRNGTLGITCLSCNTKHGLMPGDSYCDVPKNHKFCRSCKTIKPLSMFSLRRDSKVTYPVSKCKPCSLAAQKDWRLKNPEKYQSLNKKHNDQKKLNPEKYKELDKKYYIERKEKNNGNIPI